MLFDADGVIQTTTPAFREQLAALLPPGDSRADEFIADIFAL